MFDGFHLVFTAPELERAQLRISNGKKNSIKVNVCVVKENRFYKAVIHF